MKLRLSLFLLCALLFCSSSFGQTISSLQDDIAKAEREIARTNSLLKEVKNKRSGTTDELYMVQSTIRNRKKIITSMDRQMAIIKKDISGGNTKISSLESDLKKLKEEYSKTLIASYKNYKLSNYALFIFSARDFNDLALRLYYLQLHSRDRQDKAKSIEDSSKEIEQKIDDLTTKKSDLDKVLAQKNGEVKKLAKEENDHKKILSSLKNQEGDLSGKIKKQQRLIKSLESKIQEIIAEEARKMKKENSASKEVAALSIKLTGDFTSNKGKLPMPLVGGVVVEPFGTHPHPTQPNLSVNNKGVNIASEPGSRVIAIFKGKVTKILFFKGLGNCVMVRHGSYISVYSNLDKVDVKVGQSVDTGQKLGSVAGASGDMGGVLHFELWKETTVVNPQSWITSR